MLTFGRVFHRIAKKATGVEGGEERREPQERQGLGPGVPRIEGGGRHPDHQSTDRDRPQRVVEAVSPRGTGDRQEEESEGGDTDEPTLEKDLKVDRMGLIPDGDREVALGNPLVGRELGVGSEGVGGAAEAVSEQGVVVPLPQR